MSDTREHETGSGRADGETLDLHEGGVAGESASGDGTDAPEDGGMSAADVEDILALARSGDEVPVGAEDFAEALLIVAKQRDEHFQTLQRTVADYQNFQRRARLNERETRELASMGAVQSMIPVLDFFEMALKQNPDTATAAQVMGGVEMIKTEFVRVLGNQGVGTIKPAGGDEFDPLKHEAIERTSATEIEPGRVVETRSPGYTMGDRVIRPAKVVIATADEDAARDLNTDDTSGDA